MADTPDHPAPISRSLVTRLIYLIGVAALVIAIVLTRSPGAAASPAAVPLQTTSASAPASPPEITVTGVGAVYGTPDTLDVQMDVSTQAAHASAALSQNESQTNALIQTLTGSGVSTSDIQTASLSIYPTYGSDGSAITGYQVDETVAVTLHDLSTPAAFSMPRRGRSATTSASGRCRSPSVTPARSWPRRVPRR